MAEMEEFVAPGIKKKDLLAAQLYSSCLAASSQARGRPTAGLQRTTLRPHPIMGDLFKERVVHRQDQPEWAFQLPLLRQDTEMETAERLAIEELSRTNTPSTKTAAVIVIE
jgi:hypothetical protein